METQSNMSIPIIFTPDNEPYIGRNALHRFDNMICILMDMNAKIAPITFSTALTDHQKMACQIVPQGLSIMLAIRELIRQGYLFGAFVMLRSFIERVCILMYLHFYPNEITKWNDGWSLKDNAPSLSKMLEEIQKNLNIENIIPGKDLTSSMNDIQHGKPGSAPWSIVFLEEGKIGHAVSKTLNRPDLCDSLCIDILAWIVMMQSMMENYFPSHNQA